MKRVKEQPLGLLIRQFLREEGLESPLNEYRAVSSWNKLMGDVVARYTASVNLRNGTLFVSLRNPALRQNLLMQRTDIMQKINDHVGAQVVQNIVFR